MSVPIPAGFGIHLRRQPGWTDWRQRLPRLIGDVCAEWELTRDGDAAFGYAALVLPVRQTDGTPAVVKFAWPDPDNPHEHLALRAWDGRGAVRLLRADPRRSVLLLERADPARDLTGIPVLEACAVVATLYGVLHRPALPQLDRLSALAAAWADRLPRLSASGLVPRRFVEQAIGLARDFAVDPAVDGTLLHRDLHYENVLAAQRDEVGLAGDWLAIDPQPISGEPAYEVAPLLWNRWDEALAADRVRDVLLDRFYAVVDQAGLDEDRARAWVIVRELVNVLWAVEDTDLGQPLNRSEITAATTIVKAVQR